MLRRNTLWLPLAASFAVVAAFTIGCAGDVASTPSTPSTNSTGSSTGAAVTETVEQTVSTTVAPADGTACTLTVDGMT